MRDILGELAVANLAREQEMKTDGSGSITDALFRATELGGEAGEVLGAVKKIVRALTASSFAKGQPDLDALYQNLYEEIGDVIICVDRLAAVFGADPRSCVPMKFNKTSRKVGSETLMREFP